MVHAERRFTRRLPERLRMLTRLACAATLSCAAASSSTWAHDVTADPIPGLPGWRMGAGLALSGLHASETIWPAARYQGVLGNGVTPASRRGGTLEHATLDAGLRLNDWLGATATLGKHGSDRAHFEAARLETRLPVEADWRLSLGRDRVPMGDGVTGAGHFDRFALPPLAKRVMLGDDWIEDGANLRWLAGNPDGLVQVANLGVWRARTFPGAASGPAAPAAHVQLDWPDWRLDLFAAQARPQGRGTPVVSSNAVHSHSVPDCARDLTNLVCFDGRSRLGGFNLTWAPHGSTVQLRLAALLQQEHGRLASTVGWADYRGQTQAGWLEGIWRATPDWELASRLERLSTRQRLEGPGATDVAAAAGLVPNEPVSRAALALAWTGQTDLRLSLEAGQEQQADLRGRWIGLRMVWMPQGWLTGGW